MFTAVTSTKIFCSDQCPARAPKPENRLRLGSVRDCLGLGCRPCKRCKPMHIDGVPEWLSGLLDSIESIVESNENFESVFSSRSLPDQNSISRWMKAKHQITLNTYLRMRRLAKEIGTTWMDSRSSIRTSPKLRFISLSPSETSSNGSARSPALSEAILINRILTPLGPMVVAASDRGIVLLEFADRRMLETQLIRVAKIFNCRFQLGVNAAMKRLAKEMSQYFSARRSEFSVPLLDDGSAFQCEVWQQLKRIPAGETSTYSRLARQINKPKAVRAVGKANGDNRLTILIPCHRVIGSDGALTGYGGGIERKRWLLHHERQMAGGTL